MANGLRASFRRDSDAARATLTSAESAQAAREAGMAQRAALAGGDDQRERIELGALALVHGQRPRELESIAQRFDLEREQRQVNVCAMPPLVVPASSLHERC